MSELLKQAALTAGRKRLPEMAAEAAVSAPVLQPDHKNKLAAAFATELAELREEARSDGYLAGYEAGKVDASEHFAKKERELADVNTKKMAELGAAISALTALKATLEKEHQHALNLLEPTVLSLAYAGLTRLLAQAEVFKPVLISIVHQAVETFGQQQPVAITIAESDAALLRSVPELQPWLAQMVVDKQLSAGACIVECGPRSLDASLTTQLEQLRLALLGSAGS